MNRDDRAGEVDRQESAFARFRLEDCGEYDARGIRVAQTVDGVETRYQVDHLNPTGYAPVLEELDSSGDVTRTYTLGLDVVSQAESSGEVYFLLYDGHGSTRALLDASGGFVTDENCPAIEVPIVIVRVKTPAGIHSPAPTLSTMRQRIRLSNDFRGQYGIALRVDRAYEIDRPEWFELSIEGAGGGEVNDAINQLSADNGGKIIVMSVGEFEDELRTSGVTAESRNGFAIVSPHWATIAHEFGYVGWRMRHVGGVKYNLMAGSISDIAHPGNVDDVFLSQTQVNAIRHRLSRQY